MNKGMNEKIKNDRMTNRKCTLNCKLKSGNSKLINRGHGITGRIDGVWSDELCMEYRKD